MKNIFITLLSITIFFSSNIIKANENTDINNEREELENCYRNISPLDNFDYFQIAIDKLPENTDWNSVNTIVGEDGYIWHRLEVKEKKLQVGEFEDASVTANVPKNSQVVLLQFFPEEENGILKKPSGNGVCMVISKKTDKRFVSYDINAVDILNKDKQIFDFYYNTGKKAEKGDSYKPFYIGTHLPANIVELEFGSLEQDVNKNQDLNENSQRNNQSKLYVQNEQCLIAPYLAITLDPINIDKRVIKNNFDGLYGEKLEIWQFEKHTFGVRSETGGGYETSREITNKMIITELIKKLMLATHINKGNYLNKIDKKNLENNELEIVKIVKSIIIGDNKTREENLNNLNKILTKIQNNKILGDFDSKFPRISNTIPNKKTLDELFPENIDEDEWAEIFIDMLKFWTKSTNQRHCLVRNDGSHGMNFNFVDRYEPRYHPETKNIGYAQGVSPYITFYNFKDKYIKPVFKNIIITFSDKEFNNNESFLIKENVSKPIFYRYKSLEKFNNKNILGSVCTSRKEIYNFIDSLKYKYNLRNNEIELIKKELKREFPMDYNNYYKLTLHHPSVVNDRFIWKEVNKDKKLNILQLFFSYEKNSCKNKKFFISERFKDLNNNSYQNRDGFEVGILE